MQKEITLEQYTSSDVIPEEVLSGIHGKESEDFLSPLFEGKERVFFVNPQKILEK